MVVAESMVVGKNLAHPLEEVKKLLEFESKNFSGLLVPEVLGQSIALIQNKNKIGLQARDPLSVATEVQRIVWVVETAELGENGGPGFFGEVKVLETGAVPAMQSVTVLISFEHRVTPVLLCELESLREFFVCDFGHTLLQVFGFCLFFNFCSLGLVFNVHFRAIFPHSVSLLIFY